MSACPLPAFPMGEAQLLPQGVWLWVEWAEWLAKEGEAPAEPPLSPREEAYWQKLSHPRRRQEWKHGRLLAKRLLAKALGGAAESFEVLPQEAGPPGVLCEGKPLQGGWLSISHSVSCVGVAFAPFAVGLDICDKADAERIERLAHRFLFWHEVTICPDPTYLSAMWALKEAALKMQGGGIFRPGLRSIRVHSLVPPVLASPRAEAVLYRLPLAYACLVFCT